MNDEQRRETINNMVKAMTDQGLLIEAGWVAFQHIFMSDPTVTGQQKHDMRIAFFCGAQHIFGSVINMLDPGDEPSDKDLARMDSVSQEIDRFAAWIKQHVEHRDGKGPAPSNDWRA